MKYVHIKSRLVMSDTFDKKPLNEEETKLHLITPAIEKAGWDKKRIRMEWSYTDGEIIVRDNSKHRGKKKKVDYVLLSDDNYPIAIVEAKKEQLAHYDGIQQAIDYANDLDVPFAFSSTGRKFRFYNSLDKNNLEKDIEMDEFPSPEELMRMYRDYKKITEKEEEVVRQPYFTSYDVYPPRYYQRIAINRTVEHVAKGNKRGLLVMATGTGKTYTAFQIIWRLLKANPTWKVLYLADRNVLIDQTMANDFKPFGSKMTKIKERKVDSSHQIYMSLYTQLVKNADELKEGEKQPYESFDKDAFGLIMVDECHRSSVRDDSQWKDILKYFSSAVQIGMTATPRNAEGGSNIDYFKTLIYSYSLIQGIQDGFLAPYRVVQSTLNKDLEGYIPLPGEKDLLGQEFDRSIFVRYDFGNDIQLMNRQRIVAKRITKMLEDIGKMKKTIVFCPREDEAALMRDLLIEYNKEEYKKNNNYVVRITSSDRVGKMLLDNFIDPFSDYPVIATTSMLLTTGVDCKTCELIAIDKEVSSSTEFKQMIGRGTRIHEKSGKMSFTILDFRGVTNKFFDREFDEIDDKREFSKATTSKKDEKPKEGQQENDGKEEPKKYYVTGGEVNIVNEKVMYLGADGKLVTEKFTDFTKKNILGKYPTIDVFRGAWAKADRKKAVLDELKENSVWLDDIKKSHPEWEGMDEFDLVCHLAYGEKPLTRRERIDNVKKRNCFAKYGEKAREVIDALLEQYAESGVADIESLSVLDLSVFSKFGKKPKIIRLFNNRKGYDEAIMEIEKEIYEIA